LTRFDGQGHLTDRAIVPSEAHAAIDARTVVGKTLLVA
jgi:hypothetical protein